MVKGIGVNVDTGRIGGVLSKLERELEFFKKLNVDYVEIPPAGLDVILKGKILKNRLDRVKGVLEKWNFKYTVHAPDITNLKNKFNPLHMEVMKSTLQFAKEIKAEVVVYHCGEIDHDLDLAAKDQVRAEIESLRILGDLAQDYNLVIGVENTTQTMEEVLELVESVDHPNVGITLDIAHLFTITNYYGLDFIKQIELALLKIVELHVSDNLGEYALTYKEIPETYHFRFVYGLGDIHLPLGMGIIPYEDVINIFKKNDFEGIVILEINSMDRFIDEYRSSLKILREGFER